MVLSYTSYTHMITKMPVPLLQSISNFPAISITSHFVSGLLELGNTSLPNLVTNVCLQGVFFIGKL